tara:strand:+ start:1080 stop:3575 length:2496 start_codon:yes stop_codon:yes gene_type:complete
MPLTKIQVPPGVNKQSTSYAAGQTWYDANNVRWRTASAESIGGWRIDPSNSSTFYGVTRAIWSWKDFSNDSFRFIGTNNKFYIATGENKYDITPVRATASGLSNPFQQIRHNVNIVTIEDGEHGASVGDFVVFTAVGSGFAGITAESLTSVDEGFEIVEVLDDDHYMIALYDSNYSKILPNTNVASGGGSCDLSYKIPSGINSSIPSGTGWGAGTWGQEDPLGVGGAGYTLSKVEVTTGAADQNLVFSMTSTLASTIGAVAVNDLIYISEFTQRTSGGGTSTTTSIGDAPLTFAEISNNWYTVAAVDSASTPNTITVASPLGSTFTSAGEANGPQDSSGNAVKFGIADYDASDGSYTTRTGLTRNWGSASSQSLEVAEHRKVYVDNFGEDILISNSNGPIYYYDTSANTNVGLPIEGNVAVDITSVSGQLEAVETCTKFLMSERFGHCVALGANDVGASSPNSMLVRWSDAFNPFDWFPTPSNEAGGQVLDEGSSIVTGMPTKNENLIFTNSALYSMKYVGFPITYGFTLVTSKASIVSEKAATVADDNIFFMANDGFYVYNGRLFPLSDNVTNYVFDDINREEISKCFVHTNFKFSEVLFFYPSSNSKECDRFVSYNYSNKTWSIGSYDMSSLGESGSGSETEAGTTYNRTSWDDARVYDLPVAGVIERYNTSVSETTGGATGDGQPSTVTVPAVRSMLFTHEDGTLAQASPIDAHVETGDMDLMDGQQYAFYQRIIPDIDIFNTTGDSTRDITVGVKGRDLPGKAQKSEKSVTVRYSSGDTETYAPEFNSTAIRGRARSASIRVSASSADFSWRLGDIRIDLKPDGEKS